MYNGAEHVSGIILLIFDFEPHEFPLIKSAG
jgi:hypothetical protein